MYTIFGQSYMVRCSRDAPYKLNEKKQVANLAKDASIKSFEIEVTGDTNVNIHCSAGFYIAVARPAFNICDGFETMVSGIRIKCIDVFAKSDSHGTVDCHLLKFVVGGEAQQDNVAVHLYHTKRMVQVQGRAALWFVEEVLKERFVNAAKKKSYDIADINKKILQMTKVHPEPSNLAQSCGFCKKIFRSNAKPSQCTVCCKFFHRSKTYQCFSLHSCQHHDGNQAVSQSNPESSQVHPQTSNQSHQSISLLANLASQPSTLACLVTSTTASLTSSRHSPLPSTSAGQRAPSTSYLIPSLMSSGSATQLSSPPTIPVTITTTIPTSLNQAAPHFATSARNKQKNSPPISKEQAENEYLKVELSNARTEIVKLDTEIGEYKKKIVVLNARVKIMAEKENDKLHAEYFPDDGPRPSQPCSSLPSQPKYQGCPPPCHAPYFCAYRCHYPTSSFGSCQASQAQPMSPSKLLELEQMIATLGDDMKALKQTLESVQYQGNIAPVATQKPSSMNNSMGQGRETAANNDNISPADIEEFLFPDENLN